MITPVTELKNYFYFYKTVGNSAVIYKISNTNDTSGCGKQAMHFTADGKPNDDVNKAIFPCFWVNYKETIDQETPYTKYYWLQNMIQDGDTCTIGQTADYPIEKFTMNTECAERGGQTYIKAFENSFKKDVERYIKQGYTFDQIKKIMPYYCFDHAKQEGDPLDIVKINGKNVYFVSIEFADENDNFEPMKQSDLENIMFQTINDQCVSYAEEILAIYNREYTGQTNNWITRDTTQSTNSNQQP